MNATPVDEPDDGSAAPSAPLVPQQRRDDPLGDLDGHGGGGLPPPAESSRPARPGHPRTFMRTDVGNGERLRHYFGHVLRFVPGMGWFTWDDTRWLRDQRGLVVEYAKRTSRIFDEAKLAADDEESVKLGKWAAASQNMSRIHAMVTAAQTLEGIVVLAADLDQDPWLLNVQNGTLDLRSGMRRRHNPDDHLTKICPVEYDPAATCPTWDAFLFRVLRGSDDLIRSCSARWATR